MTYKSIDDPEFERSVSLRDAYRIMERFVADYLRRGDTSVVELIAYLGVGPDGRSSDPAAVYDFLDAAKSFVGSAKEREGR